MGGCRRPGISCHYVERVATELRMLAWQGMTDAFSIPDHDATLRSERGYAPRELDEIRRLLDVFDYGNPKYFLLATVAREALRGTTPIGTSRPEPSDRLPRPPVQATGTATMLEEHHADADLRSLYKDMKATLGLPFVNSDYKAMARWPTYLTLAWDTLKPSVDTQPYHALRNTLDDACIDAAHHIPHTYELHRGELDQLDLSQPVIDELIDVTHLFQWLLSGLILNITCCKIALNRGS